MIRALLAVAAAIACLPWLAVADDPPPASGSETPAPALSDVQDLVFLGDTRPVYIRLHIRVDGKPLRAVWEEFLTSLFQYLDTDGDGVLSQAELDRAPKPATLIQMLRGNYSNPNVPKDRPPIELGITLVGGKVTRDGLANYYRISGVEAFYALIRDETTHEEGLTDVLFRELDANKDEKLSKDELVRAAVVLHKLDLNDDEMISDEELLPSSSDMMANGAMPQQEKTVVLTDSSAFILLGPTDSPSRLAYPLISKYDKDDDQKLSRTEINLEKAVFDQLDADHDGFLDAKELASFLKFQPLDAEVMVRLGNVAEDQVPLDFNGNVTPLATAALRKLDNGFLSMTFGDALVELGAETGTDPAYKSARQIILAQYDAADEKLKRGFLDAKQADRDPALRELFQHADRNGDGKLTREELIAYVDLLGKAVGSSAVLLVTDHGRSLFSLMNPHHDGRLRQRELRSAWARVQPWDKNHDGFLEREELPHQFDIYVNQGQSGGVIPAAATMTRARTKRRAAISKGPLWFQRMDRNGDGYVSLREFLGSKEEFQRIDSDGDGLISPEEADRADAKLKNQGGKQR